VDYSTLKILNQERIIRESLLVFSSKLRKEPPSPGGEDEPPDTFTVIVPAINVYGNPYVPYPADSNYVELIGTRFALLGRFTNADGSPEVVGSIVFTHADGRQVMEVCNVTPEGDIVLDSMVVIRAMAEKEGEVPLSISDIKGDQNSLIERLIARQST